MSKAEVPLEVVSLDTTKFSVFSRIQFCHILAQKPYIRDSKFTGQKILEILGRMKTHEVISYLATLERL